MSQTLQLVKPAVTTVLVTAAVCALAAAIFSWVAVSSATELLRMPFSIASLVLLCILAQGALEFGRRSTAVVVAGAVALIVTTTITTWVMNLPSPFGLLLFTIRATTENGSFPSIYGVLAAMPLALGSLATLWLALNVGQQIGRPLGWATGLTLLVAATIYLLMAPIGWLGLHNASVITMLLSPIALLIVCAIALYGAALLTSRHTHLFGKVDSGARVRAIAVVLAVAATLILWHTLRAAEIRQLHTDLDAAVSAVDSALREGLEDDAHARNRLAAHWRNLNWQIPNALFRADSEILLHDYPAITAIVITDAQGRVINAAGRESPVLKDSRNEGTIALIDRNHLSLPLQADNEGLVLAKQANLAHASLSDIPAAGSYNGPQIFFSADPVYDGNDQFLGTLISAYRRDLKIKSIVESAATDFQLQVFIDNAPIYERLLGAEAGSLAPLYRAARREYIDGVDYSFELTPTSRTVARNLTWTPTLVLLAIWASLLLLIFALYNERRAHALLRDRERILNQSLDMICTLDVAGNIASMNEASQRLLGYESKVLLGRPLMDFVHAVERDDARQEWLNKDVSATTHTRPTRFARSDGQIIYLQGLARWSRDEQLLYFTIRNVTDHHQLELERQHASETLHIGVAQAGCVVYEFLPNKGRIEWVGAVRALTGFEPLEFAQRGFDGWIEAIHPEDRAHARQTLQHCLDTKQPHTIDYRLLRKNGSYVAVLDRGRYVIDDEQTGPRMIGALIDLTAIRQQEQALRRSEERYRIIATQVGSVIMERESATGRVQVYGPVEDIFGYTKKQMESRQVSHHDVMVHPEDRERVQAAVTAAEKKLSTYYVEYRRRHSGEHYIYIAARGVVLPGPDGKAERMIVAITDITARKKSELLLKQSEERFRLAAEHAKQIVYEYSYDAHGRIESKRFAGAAEQLLGYSIEELDALYATEHFPLVHPDDLHLIRAITLAHIDTAGAFRLEHRMRHKNGNYIYVESHGAARRNTKGELIGILGLLFDISARKAAEVERQRYTMQLHMLAEVARKVGTLQSLHELLNYLAASMRELVGANAATASINPSALTEDRPEDGIIAISYANHYATQRGRALTFGSPELHDLLKTSDGPVRLSSEQTSTDTRWKNLTQNDDLRHPLRGWLAVALSARSGAQLGVLELTEKLDGEFNDSDAQVLSQLAGLASVAIENIRLYATLEERVAARTRELQVSNRELEAFSYSVSHDLRAPLRAIAGFSSILEQDYGAKLDAGARRYLQRITGAVERMANLIDDLLSLARVSRLDIKHEPVDLTALCHSISKRQLERHPNRSIDIKVDSRMRVIADPRLVEVAMENLIENAIKFTGTRHETLIHVGRRMTDGKPAFFVRDNGVGFDPQYAANLFGVFQRLHSTTEFPGTGVGLATVQRIIQRHHGRVWAESQIDQGASFYFTFDSEI